MKYQKIKWFVGLLILTMAVGNAEDFFKIKKQVIDEAQLKIFTLYISPALVIGNAGYNTNIYAYQAEAKPDWTVDAGINLRAASILKDRLILMITEYPYYSFYLKNKEEEAFNNKFQLGAYTHIGKLNFNYILHLNNTRECPNSEFGARTRQKERKQLISIDYGRYDRFYIHLYAGYNQNQYTDEQYLHRYDLSDLDRDDILLGIALKKRIFTQTRMSVGCEYYDYRFRNTPERNGSGAKLYLGIDFPEISSITGSLRIGWTAFSPHNPGYYDFKKPFGTGKINIRLFKRIRFHFNYLLDNFFTFTRIDQYFDEHSGAAGVDFYFSQRIKIGYGYRAGNLTYRNLADSSKMRSDAFSSSSLAIGFRILRRIGIVFNYTIYRMDSTVTNFNCKYSFIGGHITHEF